MNAPKSVASRHAVLYVITPAIVLLTAATLLGPFGVGPRDSARLSASASNLRDEDGDGLISRQERILETILSAPDSDLDGYGDAEELARNTSPLNGQLQPMNEAVDVAITARGEPDGMHALIAIYVPGSLFDQLDVRLGVLAGRQMSFIRRAVFLSSSTVDFVPGAAANSTVALIDFRFPRTWVDATGHLSMFTTVSHRGSSTIVAAAVVDLFNVAGVVVLAMPDPSYVPSQAITGGPPQTVGHTLYKPLTIFDGEPPAGWTMGEVCFQNSSTVMTSGAVVVHEITLAECQSGWEGACPPDCSASVGSTYTTVDPAILVGG